MVKDEYMGKNRLKIAFLTATNAKDKKSRSGTLYYMGKALQKHCGDVYYLGPLDTRVEKLVQRLSHLSVKLFGKNYAHEHSILLSQRYGNMVKGKLQDESFDLIFAPVASTELAFLETEIPIIYSADATFALINDYYPDYFSHLLGVSMKEGDYIEKAAISKADLLLYPSWWAAHSAIEDYDADKSKVKVVPFGANMDNIPSTEIVLSKKKSEVCKLLFLGVDWERKGGKIAFKTLLELDKLGVEAELTICGCVPPEEFKHDRMKVIPFLDKNDAVQSKELYDLLFENHFLLLPTRSEAYGVVFCEANAFGMPALTTDTGGIPSVIDQGINGFMLSLDATGEDYAKLIKDIYDDDEKYYGLMQSSRKTFDEKLNWDSWGNTVCKLINEILEH